MDDSKRTKNKLIKGLTDRDILVWEEEKMRYQRRQGRKVTDLDFFRHLLMVTSRPIISSKDGISTGRLVGNGPIYDKGESLLDRFQAADSKS